MRKVSADEAIKRTSNRSGVPVGNTCIEGAQQYESAKKCEGFKWIPRKKHWEGEGPGGGKWYIGIGEAPGGRIVVSCGPKG